MKTWSFDICGETMSAYDSIGQGLTEAVGFAEGRLSGARVERVEVVRTESLEALIVGNPDFEEIEKSLNVFCPFEAIGMVRQEIRHAHFLAYCLDPQRPHGFGSDCLRALMRTVAVAYRVRAEGVEGEITPLDVHLMDIEQARIRREWRRIDLLVVIDEEKLVVAIELKIDASEHSGQLSRYRETVTHDWPAADGWRHLYLFLTKAGDDASEEAAEDWLPIDLEAVASELEQVVSRQAGSTEARALLAAYVSMLRRHHLTDNRLKDLAEKLWAQHREALEFLVSHKPETSDGVFASLYNRRADMARLASERSGLTVVLDDSTQSIVRLAIKEWDSYPDALTAVKWTSTNRVLLIEVQSGGDKKSIRVRFVIGPSTPEVRLNYYSALSTVGKLTQRKEITSNWTRILTEKVASELDDENLDIDKTADGAFNKIVGYIVGQAPRLGQALNEMSIQSSGEALPA